jgi:hypothetical protein
MANDFGRSGSVHSAFTCGHDNPVSSRYCDECGAPRDPRCRLCHSPNRADAKFCGACGTRLFEDPPRGENRLHATEQRRWKRDDLDLDSDGVAALEDGRADAHWRRPLLLTAVAGITLAGAIALVLALGPMRPPAPVGRQVEPTASGPASAPSERETKTEGPRAEAERAPDTAAPPSVPDVAPPASAGLPARSAGEAPGAVAEASPRRERPSPAQTSEDRMADFLVQQFGPSEAAAKALSTAAWYDTDRPEYAYWQHVAEAIERRGGR